MRRREFEQLIAEVLRRVNNAGDRRHHFRPLAQRLACVGIDVRVRRLVGNHAGQLIKPFLECGHLLLLVLFALFVSPC